MTGNAVVTAEQVSKKFQLFKEKNNSLKATIMRRNRIVGQDFWALRDVSFEVAEGETFGLIGENGSGKSTMLKCLTRILRPTSGTVTVEGKVSSLLELGAGFHPELTGRENIFLNGAILGLSQRELRRRFDEIVEFAGVGPFIDEAVKNYSSGMFVRLGFSVAINVDPDVLLVDEVLAVGDEAFQRKCTEKFNELRNKGKTIVMVSHGLAEVQRTCNRVAWFSHGKLMELGDPKEVIDAYTDTVAVNRRVDEEGRPRSGTGEARITGLELIDALGQPMGKAHSGEGAGFRLHYEMDHPIERPVFALDIHTLSGFVVAVPRSLDTRAVPDKLEGSGSVEVRFDHLQLMPGTYDVSAVLTEDDLVRVYDNRTNLLRFDVEQGKLAEEGGVVSLGGAWDVGVRDRR